MEFQETEQQPQKQEVAIYSKWAILLFSILASPLVGGILLMINLRSAGYKREGTRVILFVIAFLFVAAMVIASVMNLPAKVDIMALMKSTQYLMYNLVAQIICGGILAEYFFKKYFPGDNYKYKSVWRPLAVIFIIILISSILR
jgi:hypothetical protein